MSVTASHIMAERLVELERTVEVLNQRVVQLQQQLQEARRDHLTTKLWRAIYALYQTDELAWRRPVLAVRENKRLVTNGDGVHRA